MRTDVRYGERYRSEAKSDWYGLGLGREQMVAKEDMWDDIVTMKGCKYTMESELTKRR